MPITEEKTETKQVTNYSQSVLEVPRWKLSDICPAESPALGGRVDFGFPSCFKALTLCQVHPHANLTKFKLLHLALSYILFIWITN